MTKQSLQASIEGLKKAHKAFSRTELTQEQLAEEVGCTRQPIWKFFAGKPVRRQLFREICHRLELDWEEIAVRDSEAEQETDTNIDSLVQEVREKLYLTLQQRCGKMRVLDMSHPIDLINIYTHIHILEKIPNKRHLKIADLWQGGTPENFYRVGLTKVTENRVLGLEAVKRYPKLMVLGKPGSGKTTFLKYLTIQCNEGKFQGHLVPIFLTLKDFAEAESCPSLLEYITDFCATCSVNQAQVKQLLQQGRLMLLLDGLDEVTAVDNSRVIKQIRDFSEQFHINQCVLTCRTAAQEYIFEKFTEVEVADFDDQQITIFTDKWFKYQNLDKADRFRQKLNKNQPIKELATNPLLLTLLCLVLEERTDFPSNLSELYKEGLDVLLKKWDAERNIERAQVYQQLSLQHKKDLLSKIALVNFEQGHYFFKQKELEEQIADYFSNLPEFITEQQELQLSSEAVIKSIEVQHGLLVERVRGYYSFSHLTFQEYFTAREIVVNASSQTFKKLVSQITEPRWREVFLLAIGMLRNADELLQLMQQQIDELISSDEKLQQVLSWCKQKSLSVEVPYKPVAIRAFYFALAAVPALYFALSLAFNIDRQKANVFLFARALDPTLKYDPTLELDLTLTRTLIFAQSCNCDSSTYTFALYAFYACDHALTLTFEPKLKQALEQLHNQLPAPDVAEENLKFWWQVNGKAWAEKLRKVMIEHRNIGYHWQFNEQQKQTLDQYNSTNQLLVDCLNRDCSVSSQVKREIEDALFLPK